MICTPLLSCSALRYNAVTALRRHAPNTLLPSSPSYCHAAMLPYASDDFTLLTRCCCYDAADAMLPELDTLPSPRCFYAHFAMLPAYASATPCLCHDVTMPPPAAPLYAAPAEDTELLLLTLSAFRRATAAACITLPLLSAIFAIIVASDALVAMLPARRHTLPCHAAMLHTLAYARCRHVHHLPRHDC